MTLKLPEPLPYDYVDELLDNGHVWGTKWFMDDLDDFGNEYAEEVRMTYPFARRLDEHGDESVSNCPAPLAAVKGDYSYSQMKEDEEGYVHMTSEFGFVWTAEEWTDEHVDDFLGIGDEDDDETVVVGLAGGWVNVGYTTEDAASV